LVECDLAKVDVAGSSPVARSKMNPIRRPPAGGFFRDESEFESDVLSTFMSSIQH
jgi:hypothetical protein